MHPVCSGEREPQLLHGVFVGGRGGVRAAVEIRGAFLFPFDGRLRDDATRAWRRYESPIHLLCIGSL